ncbi:hypothetical protein [Kineococcus sp. SYSU DK005]|uniref:hypothetical protein n=1 Tax=Kineococcus sp. SYSU DK005 TaxID=3383126 RepID=UPI003D7EED63
MSHQHDPARRSALRTLTTAAFVLSVVFFLLAGLVTVVGQSVTLVAGDASAAREWADHLAPYAFGGASAAGLLSFALSYGSHQAADGDGADEDPADEDPADEDPADGDPADGGGVQDGGADGGQEGDPQDAGAHGAGAPVVSGTGRAEQGHGRG